MAGRLVSVVIPAYEAGRFLAEAVDSALGQDHRPLEVIVVDDGSSDDTARVAAGYGSRITCIGLPHLGVSAARNRGIAASSGRFLALLDADDAFLPGKIALQVRELEADPQLDMVFTHMVNYRAPAAPGDDPDAGTSLPLPGLLPGTLLVRRESFDRVGPFDEAVRFGEFAEWLLRARELGLREKILPQVLLRRRIHGGNLGVRKRDEREQYVRIIKAALDRRRAAQRPAP